MDAAYEAFAELGLAGVRVEAVARRLGVTKGSFYWHFTDRQALVEAVVARWEKTQTDAVIERAQAVSQDPRDRLAALFVDVAKQAPHRSGERYLYLDASDAGADEQVVDAVRRVTRRRVDYVASLLVALGFAPDEAQRRGTAALAAAIGLAQLAPFGASTDRTQAEALTRTVLEMTVGR